jgi:hypothetical protein
MTDTAKWSGYFKIVTPQHATVKMTDSQEMADAGAYNNYTWYSRLIQGSASRMTRYREYSLMNNDIEVSRALDTLSEEMTGNNPKSKEPLLIDILSEDEDNVDSVAVLTLKAALRRWGLIHQFNTRLYRIARFTVMYGDVFFRKQKTAYDQWVFIHPQNVVAAIVDIEDATKIVAWQIKSDIKKPRTGGYGLPMGAKESTQHETEIVSAKELVRFTLNDDMSDTQPFGESVLRPVYRAHKQKELLEDAIIIYRIQRAPERRVFYIDVGKMPPQRVKQYLESIKNEIKQKKVPTMNGGQSEIDSVYNPQSMCLDLNTKIPLLDGRTATLQTLITEHDSGKENWVYSIDPNTGNYVPGIISWAGITRTNTETVKLTLDNGDEITCTPDHHFFVQGKGYEKVKAKDLTPEHSLWPFQTRTEKIRSTSSDNAAKYTQVYNPATKSWKFVHRVVANYMKESGHINEMVHNEQYINDTKKTIHHKDFNANNNTPDNLTWMNGKDHSAYHIQLNPNQTAMFSEDMIIRFVELSNNDIHIKFKDLMILLNNDIQFMFLYKKANPKQEGTKFKLKTDEFRQKMFLVFIKQLGFKNWKEYQQYIIQEKIDQSNLDLSNHNETDIKLIQFVIWLTKNIGIHNYKLVNYLTENDRVWNKFCKLYENVFSGKFNTRHKKLNTPEASMFERIAKYFGYNNFKQLVAESANFNHRVIKIEEGPIMDTGTLTIDKGHKYHNHHNFVIQTSNDNNKLQGIVTANSEDFFFASRPDGRGSRVDTLPGGQGLGELSDLEYFKKKVWRGLKIPVSYMTDQGDGGQLFNDGKVGLAYIEELRFSLYVERLQAYLEATLDVEFKLFLRQNNINIDESMYRVVLPEPSNFGKYKQLEVDGAMLSTYVSADGISHLSPRFTMKRFLQMTDEEIITNERMKREELGLDPDGGDEDLQTLYGGMEGGEGAMGAGALGGGFGGTDLGLGTDTGTPGTPPSAGGETPPT